MNQPQSDEISEKRNRKRKKINIKNANENRMIKGNFNKIMKIRITKIYYNFKQKLKH